MINFVSTVSAVVVTALLAPPLRNVTEPYAVRLITYNYQEQYWQISHMAYVAFCFLGVFVTARIAVHALLDR